jgi:hypothetical protein
LSTSANDDEGGEKNQKIVHNSQAGVEHKGMSQHFLSTSCADFDLLFALGNLPSKIENV